MVYQCKPGAQLKINVQAAGERIDAIQRKNSGVVTPKLVLADARSKKSPLHNHFEWDDGLAAESYRLDQARYLLRSIEIVVIGDKKHDPIRAFFHVGAPTEYKTSKSVMESRQLRDELLASAMSELDAFRRKYGRLTELAAVFAAIDGVRKKRKTG